MKKNIFIYFLGFLVILCSLIIPGCSKESPSESQQNSQTLDSAFSQASKFTNLKSLVISKNDSIIREQYFGIGSAAVPSDVRSVTKSVTAILIGIAIDKGYITSADDKISKYLTSVVGNYPADKDGITIRHLLTMSGGFQWNELGNVSEYNNWVNSSNQVQYILNRPLSSQPGTAFSYNSAALHLLSAILTQAAKMRTQDFAQQFLFDPMGIEKHAWELDHQGLFNGAAGINLTPHDMIKIGRLVLNHGEYQGKKIVSSQWIDNIISTHISTNAQMFASGYGYGWWTGQNQKVSYAFANGYGGQFIVVVPSLSLVVTATNYWQGVGAAADDQWYRTLNLIITVIIPAFY